MLTNSSDWVVWAQYNKSLNLEVSAGGPLEAQPPSDVVHVYGV